MFEIPEAKRVRRSELFSPASSQQSSPDPELTSLFFSKISQNFAPDLQEDATVNNDAAPSIPGNEDSTFSFRLFASQPTTAQSQIRLQSPTPQSQEPGFIRQSRSLNYYHTGETTNEKKTEYAAVAVTGENMVAWSNIPRPGLWCPWRVTYIDSQGGKILDRLPLATRQHSGTNVYHVDFPAMEIACEQRKRRPRKGKKARIAVRKKIATKKAKQEEAMQKEIAAQEKKRKKNREKKVKKRIRDKAKAIANEETVPENMVTDDASVS